jgi:signal transduction histidine kinase
MELIKSGTACKPSQGTAGELGSGIGLSMVKELLIKNKCDLDLISEIDVGTTFSIVSLKQI